MKFKALISAIAGMTFLVFLHADDSRVPWKINETYQGPHQDTFQKLRWEVPILIRQTMIDISVRLGLRFEEDWRYPLAVQFVDQAPRGVENALAYVQLFMTDKGEFLQTLNINLTAYEKEKFDFEKVLAHELTHAMLNDALGGEAAQVFPVWLHEGLAVFAADQGETMVKSYVYQTTGFTKSRLLNGLEGPHGGLDYAEDYLAVKYLHQKLGSTSLHNFVREVIQRKGDIPGALKYTCLISWEEFQKNARAYAEDEIERIGPARRGKHQKPY